MQRSGFEPRVGSVNFSLFFFPCSKVSSHLLLFACLFTGVQFPPNWASGSLYLFTYRGIGPNKALAPRLSISTPSLLAVRAGAGCRCCMVRALACGCLRVAAAGGGSGPRRCVYIGISGHGIDIERQEVPFCIAARGDCNKVSAPKNAQRKLWTGLFMCCF